MEHQRGRYIRLLRLFLIVFDLAALNILAFHFFNFNTESLYFFSNEALNNKHSLYIIYSTFFWLLSSFYLKFYKVYRYTSILSILSLLIKQFLVYAIIIYAFMGVFRSINIQAYITFKYLLIVFLNITFIKIVSFYALKKYRLYLKGNIRKVVIIGNNKAANELKNLFTKDKELGYEIQAVFSNVNDETIHGNINDSFKYLEEHKEIDEIYCAIDELSEKQVNEYVKHANIFIYNIKFISNTKSLYTKRLKTIFYNYIPVLSIQEVTLNNELNKLIKRLFDIVFSLFVIIFILSWLSVVLYVLIKIESEGPLFYKHKRNGINYKEFVCYKFRSLKTNSETENSYVKKKDDRVTKVGKYLRRTSLDELPQFFNVFFGDMSVVGPRPHMLSYTEKYSKKIEQYNFIFRHKVKPGVTGLAQISGFRGEIETDKDIIGRIKYDIFYIENWSLLLDVKIIFQTLFKVVKGDKKAY